MITMRCFYFMRLPATLICFYCWQINLFAENGLPGRLSSSYYSKDWGLLEPGVVENILKKNVLNQDDINQLSRIVSNSTSERLSQITQNIQSLAKGRGDRDDVVLLIDLKESLIDERKRILYDIVQHMKGTGLDSGRIVLLGEVLRGVNDGELTALLSALPMALSSHSSDSLGVLFTILDIASTRNLFSAGDGDTPYFTEIALMLEKLAQSEDTLFIRPKSRLLLIKMGSKAGQRLMADAIANATDPSADYTSLSYSVPEALVFIYASPDVACLDKIGSIGENVKKFNKTKLRGSFFNNVKNLLRRSERNQDMKSFDFITNYLRNEAKNQSDPQWAQLAENALQK